MPRETESGVLEFRLLPIPEQLRPGMLAAVAAVLANGPGLYVLVVARGAGSVTEVAVLAAFAVASFLFADQTGLMALRFGAGRVEVSSDTLTAYNIDGMIATRRSDVIDVGLRSRTFGRGLALIWTPLVTLRDGEVFFLDALAAGGTTAPPTERQLGPLTELRSALGLTSPITRSARPVTHPPDGPRRPAQRVVALRQPAVVRAAFAAKIVLFAVVTVAVLAIDASTPGRLYTAPIAAVVYVGLSWVIVRGRFANSAGVSRRP